MKRESDGVARGRNDRDHYQHNDDETIFLAHPLPKHTGGRLPMANGSLSAALCRVIKLPIVAGVK